MKCHKCSTENDPKAPYCNSCGVSFAPLGDASASRTRTSDNPIEELSTGFTFAGRYQIIEELGKGGMGRVYKAFDKEVNAKIAIKLIKPEVAGDQASIDRFRNELRLARDISHKNICRMYDLNKIGNTYYITMEYVRGEDLKKIMAKMGILSPGQAISIAKQVCEGLTEAHKLGIVHRDLKPSNIMLDDGGNIRIMDFGIARSMKSKDTLDSGLIIGTLEYMSPEQVEAKAVDSRSDIYALGILLYEMVTGQLPFKGNTPSALGMQHKTEAPGEPRKLNSQVPEELSQIILKCLKIQKEDRFQEIDELCMELARLEKKIPTSKKVVPVKRPSTSKAITLTLSPKRLLIPIASAIVIITAIYFIFINRPGSEGQLWKIRSVTNSGKAIKPLISPDGKFLAHVETDQVSFSASGPGYIEDELNQEEVVIVQDCVSGQSQRIFSADKILKLDWVPNSANLGVLAWNDAKGTSLYIVSRSGGQSRAIKIPTDNWAGYSWSPDGARIAIATIGSIKTKENHLIEIFDNNLEKISTYSLDLFAFPVSVETSHKYLQSIEWAPVGNQMLIQTETGGFMPVYEVFLFDYEKNITRRVYETRRALASLCFAPDASCIYILQSQEDWDRSPGAVNVQVADLVMLNLSSGRDQSDKALETLLGGVNWGGGVFLSLEEPRRHQAFSLTQDQKMIYFAEDHKNSKLWLITEEGLEDVATIRIRALTETTAGYKGSSISPDGRSVAYAKGDVGSSNVYVVSIDGSNERQITFRKSKNESPVWSPDGQQLAFGSNEGGRNRIWQVDLISGELKSYENGKIGWDFSLAWAPGHKIVYMERLWEGYYPGKDRAMVLDPQSGTASALIADSWDYIDDSFQVPIQFSDGSHFVTYARPKNDRKEQGYLIIDTKNLSCRWLGPFEYSLEGLSSDNKWIYVGTFPGGPPGDLRLPIKHARIRINDSLVEKIDLMECELDGIAFKKLPDGKPVVINIQRTLSDIWYLEKAR